MDGISHCLQLCLDIRGRDLLSSATWYLEHHGRNKQTFQPYLAHGRQRGGDMGSRVQVGTHQGGHGDGLGPGQISYKILKRMFSNPLCQWFFEWLHPNVGFAIANFWSRNSRNNNGLAQPFTSAGDENIFQHCQNTEKISHHDLYVYGHRHLTLELPVNENSIYYNIGEWIQGFTYGVYDGHEFKLKKFD